VAKPIGPTIPRRQLGDQLGRLRERARVSQSQIAERLGCSISKIQKIEAGDVSIVRAELLLMLDVYGVTGEAARSELMELQRLGKQRGWWATFGQVPAPFAAFLDLESATTNIKIFEPLVVHGLFQTESYARAIVEAWEGEPLPEDRVERQVRIKLERQRRVLAQDPPRIWVVLDEAVLRRVIGGAQVMADQLRHLSALARQFTVQVVPFACGAYPGARGGLTIFEFDERMHSPVVYVESQAGNIYLHKGEDVRRCGLAFDRLSAAALSKPESVKLINTVAREYTGL